jgi:hypothetical protein
MNITRTFLITCTAALSVMACSEGKNVSELVAGEAGNEESTRGYDVDLTSVSPEGCLNLSELNATLAALPPDAIVRRHSLNFQIDNETEDGSRVRRNFQALAAFARFKFSERASSLEALDQPTLIQHGCETLDSSNDVEGTQSFAITPGETAETLHMKDADGTEYTYRLKDARTLEVTTKGLAIDPCPSYPRAKIESTEIITWGRPDDLAKVPIMISRDMLRKISVVVQEMPEDLRGLVSTSTEDLVPVAGSDLHILKATPMESNILKCPYKAKPPTGEEPPPPAPDSPPTTLPEAPASDSPRPELGEHVRLVP